MTMILNHIFFAGMTEMGEFAGIGPGHGDSSRRALSSKGCLCRGGQCARLRTDPVQKGFTTTMISTPISSSAGNSLSSR